MVNMPVSPHLGGRGRRIKCLRPALISLQIQITEDSRNSFLNKQSKKDGGGKKKRRKRQKGERCSVRVFTFQEYFFFEKVFFIGWVWWHMPALALGRSV